MSDPFRPDRCRRGGLRLVRLAVLGALLGIALITPHATAQSDPALEKLQEIAEREREADRLESKALAAFEAGDYKAAAALLARQLELEPNDFVPHYNLACVRAQQGSIDRAVESLKRAVELGFTDHHQLLADHDLAPIRETAFYERLTEQWDRVLDARAQAHLEQIKERFGPRYTYARDPRLRLSYACACAADELEPAREEIDRLTEWALEHIFRDLRDPPMREKDPWTVVILPSAEDFKRWAVREYGPSAVMSEFHRIGGAYNHGRKELVARDLGGSFRHEFLHVLHWRSNARAGQVHPVWVQEGLCSLVEDYDITPSGELEITPSWRTNMVKRLDRARALPALEYLATLSRREFTERRPLANYAYARAVFMYLLERGVLAEWYAHFVEHFDSDPTGLESISAVLGMPIERVREDFERWVRALPEVAEARADGTISGLEVSMGVEMIPGSGRGPLVRRLLDRRARTEGFRRRDAVVEVDGRPTRDMNELVRVLDDYRPGQRVTVEIRRRDRPVELSVTLREAR